MQSGDTERIYSGASPDQVAEDLAPLLKFEENGLPLDLLKELLQKTLVPHLGRYELPSFHFLFNCIPEAGATLGAKLALEFNQGVTNWQVSPGGAVLEEMCCQELCKLFGLTSGSDATVMYCGTYANQQALYMALHKHAERRGFDLADKGVAGFENPESLAIISSVEAHFSLKHAARMLGLGEQCLVAVDVDENRRLDTTKLRDTITQLGESRDVVCIVATAGTTSTGSVDQAEPIADLCEEVGAWFHLDGAYGFAYKLVPGWSPLFAGAERADSITWDPHKQFGVPIPSSVLFAKDARDFDRVTLYSSYFNRKDAEEPNPGLKSIPTTRPMTALPIVTTIRHQGMSGLVDALRKPLDAIKELTSYLKDQPDMEIGHEPDTGIICFRIVPSGIEEDKLNDLQKKIYDYLLKEGERPVSISLLGSKTMLRLVALSPTVTCDDLIETVSKVRATVALV